jgi:hypothetical protein
MTQSVLPEPLVPADCDLRGLPFMPLYGDRLFASETWISATPEAKVAALRLWWHAYSREIPASSLPDNDVLLADYAGYGVAIKAWLKIKPSAMRGWVMCADGRWYHPVVAELTKEAWAARVSNRERQRKFRLRNEMKDGDVTVTQRLHNRREGQGQGEGQKSSTLNPADAGSAKPAVPPCPHLDIISLYHKHLPMGRQVNPELWSGTRAKHLQARWREAEKRQRVEWWEKFFMHCAASDFLTGKTPPAQGRKQFEISLDWIVNPTNFAKIYEGAYHS